MINTSSDSPQGVKATEVRGVPLHDWRVEEVTSRVLEQARTMLVDMPSHDALVQQIKLAKIISDWLNLRFPAVNSHDALVKALEEAKAEGERTDRNRDMWKGQVERQAEQIATMRAALAAFVKSHSTRGFDRNALLNAFSIAKAALSTSGAEK